MSPGAIVVFARTPVEGQVKTRLAATIGNNRALAVYQQLLEITRDAVTNLDYDKYVFYAGSLPDPGFWQGYTLIAQTGSDLGQKMFQAFEVLIKRAYKKVVIIGTDCPQITTALIQESFDKLEEADLVIGPAFDGGYYLIGARNSYQQLFENITWSSPTVLAETLNRAENLSIRWFLLTTLTDIDEEKDLVYLSTETVCDNQLPPAPR